MNKPRLFLSAFVLISVISLPAAAAGKPTVKGIELEGVVSGNNLTLAITPGPIATRGIRIYSEPSHTLLAVVVDSKFSNTTAGEKWKSEYQTSSARAFITTDLPDGRPSVTVARRPETDNAIAVHVYGLWPGGFSEDRLLSYGYVGSKDFHFMSSADAAGDSDPTHCCSGGNCSQMCVDCQGAFFWCCITNCECSIGCGAAHQCDPC